MLLSDDEMKSATKLHETNQNDNWVLVFSTCQETAVNIFTSGAASCERVRREHKTLQRRRGRPMDRRDGKQREKGVLSRTHD